MDKEELFQREEDCQKAIRTVSRAIFMRLVVTVVLIWSVVAADMDLLVMGLMALVLAINLVGTLPLISEWKKQRKLFTELIQLEE